MKCSGRHKIEYIGNMDKDHWSLMSSELTNTHKFIMFLVSSAMVSWNSIVRRMSKLFWCHTIVQLNSLWSCKFMRSLCELLTKENGVSSWRRRSICLSSVEESRHGMLFEEYQQRLDTRWSPSVILETGRYDESWPVDQYYSMCKVQKWGV